MDKVNVFFKRHDSLLHRLHAILVSRAKGNMKRSCCLPPLLLPFLLPALQPLRAQSFDLKADLARLDSAVARRHEYVRQKQEDIVRLKRMQGSYHSAAERTDYYWQLYKAYMKFDADSAFAYAQKMWQAAPDSARRLHARLELLLIKTLRGDGSGLEGDMLHLPPIEEAPVAVRAQMAYTYMAVAQRKYSEADRYAQREKRRTEMERVFKRYAPYTQAGYWLTNYYRYLLTGKPDLKAALKDYRESVQPSRQAAMTALLLSLAYREAGNREACAHYLIVSAINDIMVVNRESSSLAYLLKMSGVVDPTSRRASEYAAVLAENAQCYKDVWRSLNVMEIHSRISKGYEQALQRQQRWLCFGLALLMLSLAGLVWLLVRLRRRHKMQAALMGEMAQMNSRLEGMVRQEKWMQQRLKERGEALEEEIKKRNDNFLAVYQLVSQYIGDVEAFKKAVYNMLTAGSIAKARKELNSNAATEKYLVDFYRQFDRAFLLSHPDFPERFNALLRDEAQIPVHDGVLTPTQRIYALVSIGVTDSMSIAAFMHYSPQTIYNYRLKARHSARIPEHDLADAVAAMYR